MLAGKETLRQRKLNLYNVSNRNQYEPAARLRPVTTESYLAADRLG